MGIDLDVRRCHVAAIFLVAVTVGGCAPQISYVMSVNGLAGPKADMAKTYRLIPYRKDLSNDDLQYQEYATYLRRALEIGGFSQAANTQDANVIIFVDYGISGPHQHLYSYTIPEFGETGESSSTTYGNVYSNSYGAGVYSGTTYYQPTYGITGYSSGVGTYTTFTRMLRLLAVNAKDYETTHKMVELWDVSVLSTGSSGDLRRVFPYLVAGAAPYLAKDTDRQAVTVRFQENDERVIPIRDGLRKAKQ